MVKGEVGLSVLVVGAKVGARVCGALLGTDVGALVGARDPGMGNVKFCQYSPSSKTILLLAARAMTGKVVAGSIPTTLQPIARVDRVVFCSAPRRLTDAETDWLKSNVAAFHVVFPITKKSSMS